jgi:hypothetical protein
VRGRLPLILTLVTAGSWFTGLAGPAVLITAGSAGLYLWSLWRDPWRPCRRCGGSKVHRGRIWTGTSGRCTGCGGEGQFPRLGVKLLTPGRARALAAGQRDRYG